MMKQRYFHLNMTKFTRIIHYTLSGFPYYLLLYTYKWGWWEYDLKVFDKIQMTLNNRPYSKHDDLSSHDGTLLVTEQETILMEWRQITLPGMWEMMAAKLKQRETMFQCLLALKFRSEFHGLFPAK